MKIRSIFTVILTATALSLLCACQKPAADDSNQDPTKYPEMILGKWSVERLDETAYVLSTYYGSPDKRIFLDFGAEGILNDVSIELEFFKDGKVNEVIVDGDVEESTGYYRWVKDSGFVMTDLGFLEAKGNMINVEKLTGKEMVLLILVENADLNKIWEDRYYFSRVK